MKKVTLFILGIMVVSLGALTSCKKEKKDPVEKPSETGKPNDQQGSSAADGAMENVNDFINNKVGNGASQRTSAYNLPCGVVRVDSTLTTNSEGDPVYSYKMVYGSNTPCGYKKISGDVTFGLVDSTSFAAVGARYSITFNEYKVESNATDEVVTINGTMYITNVNGGYVWQTVVNSTTIVHKVRGTFTITHSDGVERDRSYYQRRTYTSSNSWADLTLTVAGDTVINGINVSEIGKTHTGDYYFETQILTDYVWTNCSPTGSYAGPYVLKSGKAKLDITIPFITPAYVEIEGGYYWNYNDASSTPTLVNDCTTNAYKITTVISSSNTSSYQLY